MSLLSCHSASVRRLCTRTVIAGCSSQRRTHDGTPRPSFDSGQSSFEAAGIQATIISSLRVAFPNIQKPTAMQRKLIRAICSNRHVLLQDDTGTGKSFAAMLALLSKPPLRKTDSGTFGSLLIVPHRDLAYQYLHWIHHMTLPEGDAPFSLMKYAQVLVRHANQSTLQDLPVRMQEAIRSTSSDEDLLVRQPPRILIATPNAVLELMERRPEAFRPATVVVDEVDALLRIPHSNLPRERKGVFQKVTEKHTPDLVHVLDRLYARTRDRERTHRPSYSARGANEGVPAHRPQLIMISATLRRRLQSALFSSFGWVQRGETLKLVRKRSAAVPAHRLGRSAIHHVLVISETGEIKNIAGAVPLQLDDSDNSGSLKKEDTDRDSDEDGIFLDDGDDPELRDDVDRELLHSPLAFDPAMLEAVAATFALDVPRVALLVLPATAAVRKVIFELRQLGVNAHPFDLAGNEASRRHVVARTGDDVADENPVLIVGTLATVRGVDLPDLSHVFILGVPEGRGGDAYLHVAGRVGRFGGRGKVVTVVEGRREERAGRRVVVRDAPRAMGVLLARLGLGASRLGHFA